MSSFYGCSDPCCAASHDNYGRVTLIATLAVTKDSPHLRVVISILALA